MEDKNPWEKSLPIAARPGEVYNIENTEFYDVEAAVNAINANPHSFKFGMILPEKVIPLLVGQVDFNLAEVMRISFDDAARPLLFITYENGQSYLIDGYKRARRALQFGAPTFGAWVLSPEQTAKFRLSAEAAAHVERINLTS